MKHGEAIEALEHWEAEHGETSEVLNERPIITPSLLWLWEAFWELSGARARGFGAQPLQHAQIIAYCQLQEFDANNARFLCRAVLAMDRAWLEVVEKKDDGNSG